MRKQIDASVQVLFYDARYKMFRCSMVIVRGVKLGTLYNLDACTIRCNISFMKRKHVTTSLKKI